MYASFYENNHVCDHQCEVKERERMHHTGSARSVRNVLRVRSPDPCCRLGLCLRPSEFKERKPMREPGV